MTDWNPNPNRFPGRCSCGLMVAAQKGKVEPTPDGRSMVVRCMRCARQPEIFRFPRIIRPGVAADEGPGGPDEPRD